MINEIKKHLLAYGSSYTWVKNDLGNLADEALRLIENGGAKNAEHAAFLTIDRRF